MEEWKDVRGYEGIYKVSSHGRVKSLQRVGYGGRIIDERIMKLNPDSDGYLILGLHKNGKTETKKVHRLVAESFVENPNGFKEVNHKDENKTNNCVENLEWCTTKYNLTYGHRLDCARGERNSKHKLTKEQVEEIRRVYIKGDPKFGQSALGRKYGVDHIAIGMIVNGKTWKHLLKEETTA